MKRESLACVFVASIFIATAMFGISNHDKLIAPAVYPTGWDTLDFNGSNTMIDAPPIGNIIITDISDIDFFTTWAYLDEKQGDKYLFVNIFDSTPRVGLMALLDTKTSFDIPVYLKEEKVYSIEKNPDTHNLSSNAMADNFQDTLREGLLAEPQSIAITVYGQPRILLAESCSINIDSSIIEIDERGANSEKSDYVLTHIAVASYYGNPHDPG
jgi:hypothetical protein